VREAGNGLPHLVPTLGSSPISSDAATRLPGTRFERRLAEILDHATAVFYEKGYERATLRDLSRASGISLAGLYYYFESKEELLYLIQKYYFTSVMALLQQRLQGVTDPEQRVRTFIMNHLEYFMANFKAYKVLSHEDDVLQEAMGAEIVALKREYYRSCATLVEDLKRDKHLDFNNRIAIMGLFGSINWLHTWYNPQVDGDAAAVAAEISNVFLQGIYRSRDTR
jgi:TetR/AcrR family transcriptional regulator, cholesterol catabolism regulator